MKEREFIEDIELKKQKLRVWFECREKQRIQSQKFGGCSTDPPGSEVNFVVVGSYVKARWNNRIKEMVFNWAESKAAHTRKQNRDFQRFTL